MCFSWTLCGDCTTTAESMLRRRSQWIRVNTPTTSSSSSPLVFSHCIASTTGSEVLNTNTNGKYNDISIMLKLYNNYNNDGVMIMRYLMISCTYDKLNYIGILAVERRSSEVQRN